MKKTRNYPLSEFELAIKNENEIAEKLFLELAIKKESLIKYAVLDWIGNDQAENVANCCVWIVSPDAEIFTIDGIDILRFEHVNIEITDSGVKATQKHQWLIKSGVEKKNAGQGGPGEKR